MAEPMEINERVHRLDSYRFYPRPNHFKKRLDSLMPRFDSLVDAFGDEFQDLKWRNKINETYRWLSRALVVTTMGSDEFSGNRVVITDADQLVDFPEAKTVLTSDTAGLCVTVCYIKVEDTAEKGKKTVKRLMESVSHFLKSHSLDKPKSRDTRQSDGQQLSDDEDCSTSIQHIDDKDLFKSLFIFCEVVGETSDSDIASFREYINDCVREKTDTWPCEKRIVMGPDQVTLSSLISEHVERTIMQVFCYIYEYLGRFTCVRQPQTDGKDIAFSNEVKAELCAFVGSDIDLADMRKYTEEALIENPEDTRTEDAKFIDCLVDHLTKRLKCVVLRPLALKTGLNNKMCDLCLNVIRFDKIFKKNLSLNTKEYLMRLRSFSENYDDIIKKTVEEMKECSERKTFRRNDFMVRYIRNDLSATLSEVHRELMKAVRHISTIEKMRYEIEGYFRIAGTPVGPPPVKTPPELLKDLARIRGVVGAGTIYSKLEVHIKENIDQRKTKLKIENTIKRHKYSKPYQVRQVLKEASPLEKVQQGNLIKSEKPGSMGTLGMFAEAEGLLDKSGQKSKPTLFALTCAHVVNPGRQKVQELPVLVDNGVGNGERWRKIGVGKPNLTVNIGKKKGAKLIDIAAVQVVEDLQCDCLRYIHNENGDPKPSFVKECKPGDLANKLVYKFGATTGFTEGLVCSDDYLKDINNKEFDTNYIIVIDKLPGSNHALATSGDSGSIACKATIDDEYQSCEMTTSGDSGSTLSQPKIDDKDESDDLTKTEERGSTASMSVNDEKCKRCESTKRDSGYKTDEYQDCDFVKPGDTSCTSRDIDFAKPGYDERTVDDNATIDDDAATERGFGKSGDNDGTVDNEAMVEDDTTIDDDAATERGFGKSGDDNDTVDNEAKVEDDTTIDDETERDFAKPEDDEGPVDGQVAVDTETVTYRVFANPEKDNEVTIENEAAATDCGFAKPGDSGSIVCMPAIDKTGKPCGSVALVAMINAGKLQIDGCNSDLTLAFLLHKGIETLNKTSGLQMRACTL